MLKGGAVGKRLRTTGFDTNCPLIACKSHARLHGFAVLPLISVAYA